MPPDHPAEAEAGAPPVRGSAGPLLWLWRAAFWAGAALLAGISLLPMPGVPGEAELGSLELAKHPAAYFALAVAGLQGWPGRAAAVAAGTALFGAALELLQGALPESFERSMSADDIVGNAVGIALAWAFMRAWARLPLPPGRRAWALARARRRGAD